MGCESRMGIMKVEKVFKGVERNGIHVTQNICDKKGYVEKGRRSAKDRKGR